MNRPKQHNKAKRPQLWTHPLSRSADLESRQTEERIWAEARPLVIASALQVPAAMFAVTAGYAARKALPASRISTLELTQLLGNIILWYVLPLIFIELVVCTRYSRRWMTRPASLILFNNAKARAGFVGVVALVFVLIATLIAALESTQITTLLFATSIAAIYLITTGIHRRTGWDRRCAKAIPHHLPRVRPHAPPGFLQRHHPR